MVRSITSDTKTMMNRGDDLFMALCNGKICGIAVVQLSETIPVEDGELSLIRYSLSQRFLFIRQLIVSENNTDRDAETRLLRLIGKYHPLAMDVVCLTIDQSDESLLSECGFRKYLAIRSCGGILKTA